MRFRNILFSTCVFMAAAGTAANVSVVSILPYIPNCALKCLLQEVPPTAVANPAILCTNTTLQLAVSACLQTACNYTEQILLASLEGQICDGFPKESRAWRVAIIGIVFGPLAVIAVAMRFYSRITIAKQLGIDDWLILAAAMAITTLTALDIWNCLGNGFGHHLWDIDPRRVTQLLKIFYSCEILYLLSMTLIKASILIFYLRIFQSNWFRIADITVLVATIMAGVATCLAAVFQCTPISGSWMPFSGAKCANVNALAFAAGAITIFFDVVVLILPIPELIMLKMSLRKKVTILIMFSLGGLACITSIIRLRYMIKFATSKDASFDNAEAVIWTFLEMTIAMICSCLPALRGLFAKLLPSLFEFTANPDSDKPYDPKNLSGHPHQFARLEKSGPSYNKWAIPNSGVSPEPFELESRPAGVTTSQNKAGDADNDEAEREREREEARDKETKVWIRPRFNKAGELTAFVADETDASSVSKTEASKNLSMIASRSSSTSVWCVQGPRISQEISRTMQVGGLGLGMTAPGLETRSMELAPSVRTSVRSSIRTENTHGIGDVDVHIDEGNGSEIHDEWERGRARVRDLEAGYPHADTQSEAGGVSTRKFLGSPKVLKVRGSVSSWS